MRFRDLFDNVRRFLQLGRPSRAPRGTRRRRLFVEELEGRVVPTIAAPYPPLTGLVTVVGDTDPNGPVTMPDFINQLATIADPNISAVALQIQWRDVERFEPANPYAPTAAELDLTRIQLVFDAAAESRNADGSYGKPVELLISAGFWSPEWVTGRYATPATSDSPARPADPSHIGVVTAPFQPQYNNQKDHNLGQIPLPVPWDNPNYYNAWFGFLTEIKNVYGSNRLFRSIGADGPTSVSAEATLPNNPTKDPGKLPLGDTTPYDSDLDEWIAKGYQDYGFAPGTRSNLVTAWDSVFQFYANTFTNQYVTLSTGGGISNPAQDPQFTLKQLIADGSTAVNDFQGQFSVQSDSLSGGTTGDKQAYPVHQLVIGNAGLLTTGFQTSDSDQKLGAPGNLALSLALVLQNGMQLNTKGVVSFDGILSSPATGQHVNFIELFARDVKVGDPYFKDNPADPTVQFDPAVQKVLDWGASLFDPHTLSVFGDWTIADQIITVNTDAQGGPKLTIDGNSVSYPAGQFTGINIYNTESGESIVPPAFFDTINVENTNVPVTISDLPIPIFSHSNDRVTIGNRTDGVQGINAPVQVTKSSPATDLTIDDAADPVAHTGSAAVELLRGEIKNLSPAPIYWQKSNFDALTIDGGSGDSTYDVTTTSSGTSTTINAGRGNNTINVGNADNLSDIRGALAVQGQAGVDTLNINDQAAVLKRTYILAANSLTRSGAAPITFGTSLALVVNGSSGGNDFLVTATPEINVTLTGGAGANSLTGPDAPSIWVIDGANAGTLNSKVHFYAVRKLTGGSSTDDLEFKDGANIAGKIDGGPGVNLLNYSDYHTAVFVNLLTGAATGVTGGIANFKQVHGSDHGPGMGDVLVGNGTGILLVETTGRNLIIGGSGGGATLESGSGQDIVIAGSTNYDNKHDALITIESYWSTNGGTFGLLTDSLSTGITATNGDVYKLDASTVSTHDGEGDTIILGSANDWVFWRSDGAGEDSVSGVARKEMYI